MRIALLLLLIASPAQAGSFKDEQMKIARVRGAQKNVDQKLRDRFKERGLSYPPAAIFLRVFKRDKALEVWVRKDGAYALYESYPICASSGDLGPKYEQGDGQVPEGLYTIDHFNPTSNYHLSLRVAYPNAADVARTAARAKAAGEKAPQMGGDIYIHGSCVTIGCMPLTDPLAEEVYWLALLAKDQGQKQIPIHIFPTKLTDAGLSDLGTRRAPEATMALWKQLQPFYAAFEATHKLPAFRIDKSGAYVLRN
ncbi:MAG: L,D-transpeptidase family protein [Deltaproteobacteria bacterium]|nr:L,D-transpeptidase family protein [Deltaproteobacteria bacterium]